VRDARAFGGAFATTHAAVLGTVVGRGPLTYVDTSDCEALVCAVSSVPDDARAHECDGATAARIYGVSEELLEALVAAGLPHQEVDGVRRYSHGDLHYVGLRLGTAVFQLRTFEAWAQRLKAVPGVDRTQLRIRYVPRLPAGEDGCEGSVLLPEGRTDVTLYNQRPAAEIVVRPQWEWPRIDKRVADTLEELAATTDTYLFDIREAVSLEKYAGELRGPNKMIVGGG
jgi:hypothetical protein